MIKKKIINGIEYTLGEIDNPQINKGDEFHIWGTIQKCIERGIFIKYNSGISLSGNDLADKALCRKVLSKIKK